jgi:hypothetical protein
MITDYLTTAKRDFQYYKTLGEKTFSQLEEKDCFWQFDSESNSIAVIVNHLYGNMKSRWTDFLSSDGEKQWRKRDLEFKNQLKTKAEVLNRWEQGWDCVFKSLDSINEDNFNTKIYIRSQEHSFIQAINRQLTHYAYHVGQVVYIGRLIKGSKWKYLSIPKGKSDDFNQEKFSRGKHQGQFTDDLQ